MRLLQIQAPRRHAERLTSIAESHTAVWSSLARASRSDGEETVVLSVSAPNDRVGRLVDAVMREVPEAELVLVPRGVIPIEPPLEAVDRAVHEVARRSTLELVLSSLQSLGSWRGMLSYALLSGIVAAYAVTFDAVHLLVAAMLIAPMGAPAIVSVVGLSIGDARIFGRGALRFTVSVTVLVVSAALFGALVGLDHPTSTLEDLAAISRWSALLALVAGAAGAQSQVQSERSSLVTGTATGFLVAAALSPTSAVLGLSAVVGRWDHASVMALLLALQFAGIALGGWLALASFGVGPRERTLGRGSSGWARGLAGAASLALLGLIALQARIGASHERADLSRRAVSIARAAVRDAPGVELVRVSARFTGPEDLAGGEPLLISVVLAASGGSADDPAAVDRRVADAVRSAVAREIGGVAPLVLVSQAR